MLVTRRCCLQWRLAGHHKGVFSLLNTCSPPWDPLHTQSCPIYLPREDAKHPAPLILIYFAIILQPVILVLNTVQKMLILFDLRPEVCFEFQPLCDWVSAWLWMVSAFMHKLFSCVNKPQAAKMVELICFLFLFFYHFSGPGCILYAKQHTAKYNLCQV